MLCDRLKINDDKTEFVIIGTRQQLSKVHVDSCSSTACGLPNQKEEVG